MRGLPTLRTVVCQGLCVAGLAAAAPAQPTGQETRLPQFRSGIEVLRVEVTVLDRRTRQPIRGLTVNDFVVTVDGQPQEIVALTEVVAPGADRASAEWTLEAPRGVADNRRHPIAEEERLIAIVMDDAIASGAANALYHRNIGKAAAHRIVDELGPYDRAAVIFAQFNQHAQDFTADRALLRKAIETYNPQPLHPGLAGAMSMGTLRRTREFMAGIPEHRRAVFWVTLSGGPGPDDEAQDLQVDTGTGPHRPTMMRREAETAELSAVQGAIQTARLAYVPVYPVSTRGLQAPDGRGSGWHFFGWDDNLRALARSSGGRAVINTNAPDRQITRIFDELASTYILAYSASFPMDGKVRRLQVEVTRRDAQVTLETVYFRTPRAATDEALAAARPRARALLEALEAPIAGGALPLQLAVAPFAIDDQTRQTAAVVMTLGLSLDEPVAPGGVTALDLDTRIFDGEGRKLILQHQQTASLGPKADPAAPYELALRHDLPPGRYSVRIAALLADGRAGSVYTTVTVPRFPREALSMSGVAIGRAGAAPVGGREALGSVLPFAPTVARVFTNEDVVGALVRVHQLPGRVSAVDVETRITNSADEIVYRRATAYPADAFASPLPRVEHRFELPLKTLPAGDYLLAFAAARERGAEATTREVRFSVR